jgi:MGT family glycosyltransferase
MYVAIIPMPVYGHVNPTLRTARELIDQGHEVEYYLPERFVDVVEATGATLQRLDDEFDMIAKARKHGFRPGASDEMDRERREKFGQLMTGGTDAASDVTDRIAASNPDVIVFDPMCLWGREAGDRLDAPSVAFYTSFALQEGSSLLDDLSFGPPGMRTGTETKTETGGRNKTRTSDENDKGSLPEPLADALEARGIRDPSPADFLGATVNTDLSIVPIPRTFQPDADEFSDEYLFVGPMIRTGVDQQDANLPLERLADQPSVYISLGTVVHGDETFFEACFDAFADTNWEVVVKSKDDADQLNSESPENVYVRRRVPQLDLLEQVDVFVTHGGMNSTMEALSFGTPLVVVPQGADQHTVAERVSDIGLGEELDSETITADDLYETVETVHNGAYHEAVESFQTTMSEAGGTERAADAIETITGRDGDKSSGDRTVMQE